MYRSRMLSHLRVRGKAFLHKNVLNDDVVAPPTTGPADAHFLQILKIGWHALLSV